MKIAIFKRNFYNGVDEGDVVMRFEDGLTYNLTQGKKWMDGTTADVLEGWSWKTIYNK